jgi:hypothetical protein
MVDRPVHVQRYDQRRYTRRGPVRPLGRWARATLREPRARIQYEALDRAYADTSPTISDDEKSYKMRDLSFRGSWIRDKKLSKLMVERIGSYNNFEPENINQFIGFFDPDDEVEIRIGREGSPVMYFRTRSGVGASQIYRMIETYEPFLQYDELDYVSADGVDGVRVWWD